MSSRRSLWLSRCGAILVIAGSFSLSSVSGATAFANPAFQTQWQSGEAIAPNFWGPLTLARDGQQEPYAEAPGGQRLVQYFDKARMELTNPATGVVTNGLLATELITGKQQVGDGTFQDVGPANVPVAGDPDNIGPTYAAINSDQNHLRAAAPSHGGATTSALTPTGALTSYAAGAGISDANITAYDAPTQHNVSAAFINFRTKVGIAPIGFAISEPFWSNVKVAGRQRNVLIQAFERRILTYTPDNPDPFKVEFGNIGQHYYIWRYRSGNAPPPPPVAPPSDAISPPSPVSSNIPFPAQAVGYPDQWPTEIRYPGQYVPVEVSVTPAPDSSGALYIAKLRFQGSAQIAAQQLAGFFASAGWQATPSDLGAGSSFVVVSKNDGQSSGFFVVDPDPGNPGAARIVVTVSL